MNKNDLQALETTRNKRMIKRGWTDDQIQSLRESIELGFTPADVYRANLGILEGKSYEAIQRKMWRLQND